MKTVTAEFTIVNGQENSLMAAADILLEEIKMTEKGTWLYLVSTRTNETTQSNYLVIIEAYANEQAFEQHIAPNTPWVRFANKALENGWLVADESNTTGLKSTFETLQVLGVTGQKVRRNRLILVKEPPGVQISFDI